MPEILAEIIEQSRVQSVPFGTDVLPFREGIRTYTIGRETEFRSRPFYIEGMPGFVVIDAANVKVSAKPKGDSFKNSFIVQENNGEVKLEKITELTGAKTALPCLKRVIFMIPSLATTRWGNLRCTLTIGETILYDISSHYSQKYQFGGWRMSEETVRIFLPSLDLNGEVFEKIKLRIEKTGY